MQEALGEAHVLHLPEDLFGYEYDATIERALPDAVVLPGSAEEVAAAVAIASRHRVPWCLEAPGRGSRAARCRSSAAWPS